MNELSEFSNAMIVRISINLKKFEANFLNILILEFTF